MLANLTLDDWANIATIAGGIAAVFAIVAGLATYSLQSQAAMRERQRQKYRELEYAWYVGELSSSRLAAERLLEGDKLNSNFEDLFQKLAPESYDSISIMLRFFYIVDSWAQDDFIRSTEAFKSLSRSYTWWYTMQIEPRAKTIGENPDWKELVKKHEWLYDEKIAKEFLAAKAKKLSGD